MQPSSGRHAAYARSRARISIKAELRILLNACQLIAPFAESQTRGIASSFPLHSCDGCVYPLRRYGPLKSQPGISPIGDVIVLSWDLYHFTSRPAVAHPIRWRLVAAPLTTSRENMICGFLPVMSISRGHRPGLKRQLW